MVVDVLEEKLRNWIWVDQAPRLIPMIKSGKLNYDIIERDIYAKLMAFTTTDLKQEISETIFQEWFTDINHSQVGTNNQIGTLKNCVG